jgi:uncharacterized protein (UPF0333 family)
MGNIENKNSKNRGQVMLLSALLIGGSILAATSVAGYLMLLQIRQSTNIANSAKAITAASSGIDLELYRFYKNPGQPDISFGNEAEVRTSKSGGMITSVGRAVDSYRAFSLDTSGKSALPSGN